VKPNAATADITRVVAGHKTPILKNLDVSDLPPSLAAQHYYDYAKVQLAGGIGRETVGSIALYGLGRIIVAGAGANAQQMEYTGPAMALYQAALICEPQNFRAAHELGVLLASTGQLELARNMLLGSASASPQPMMWKNLAVVHSRLGEAQLAAEAQQKAAVLEQTSPSANTPAVKWVDPVTFSQIGSASDPTLPPNTVKPATASPAEAVPAKKPSNVARSRSEWDPLNLRR
jgi:tetratricopeptide (TPR) repeat protein